MEEFQYPSEQTPFVLPNIAAGLITIWSGSIVSIPVGWVLCDGNNGTPNLQDRFVLAAGGSFAVDDSGGSVNHTHTLIPDAHDHTFGAGIILETGTDFSATLNTAVPASSLLAGGSLPPYYALAYIMKT